DKGVIRDVSDLYYLDKHALADMERMAERSAQNIIDAIDASKRRPFARFIYGLGIRHVGEHISDLLAERFGDMDTLMAAETEMLLAVPEIGPEAAGSITSFFHDPKNRETLRRILGAGVEPEFRESGGKKLEGLTFVFTGALGSMSRDEARKRVEELGGKTASSVSKKVSYVVTGGEAGSKLDKAGQLGIKTITEQEFLKLLAG
ncbi:MAG TPA: helix-hairpin-helix domain-containing protein, partial [Syntrophorhabdaceae bacterium]|nr:helix-hairpin-helix domain-containing protein [Syntrophorhabdaceae bacterium]